MRAATASLRLVYLCSALALGACGGGGGGGAGGDATVPASNQSDPQVGVSAGLKASDLTGQWRACKADSATTSLEDKYTFNAASGTQVAYAYEHTAYPSTDCSGGATGSLVRSGTVQVEAGTQQAGSLDAQKVTFSPSSLTLHGMSFSGSPTASYKQLLVITPAGELQEGDPAHVDTDGYPTSLTSLQYARQP